MLSPVKNRRYTEHIVEQLKEYVLTRELRPGDRLPSEAELSKTFEVSVGTIRESLHMLEHDGVVRIKKGPGGGIFVSEGNLFQVIESIFYALRRENASAESFDTLIETRKTLEDRIVRLAALRATDEDVSELASILAEMEEPETDHVSFVQLDTDFHVSLAKAAKNNILQMFMVAVKQLHNLVVDYEDLHDELFPVAIRFHRDIYEAVRRHQPEEAAAAMLGHLEYFDVHYGKKIRDESNEQKRR
jgi:GntR family transcriptional repressor for pyruvate dehydrogenase complex